MGQYGPQYERLFNAAWTTMPWGWCGGNPALNEGLTSLPMRTACALWTLEEAGVWPATMIESPRNCTVGWLV